MAIVEQNSFSPGAYESFTPKITREVNGEIIKLSFLLLIGILVLFIVLND